MNVAGIAFWMKMGWTLGNKGNQRLDRAAVMIFSQGNWRGSVREKHCWGGIAHAQALGSKEDQQDKQTSSKK